VQIFILGATGPIVGKLPTALHKVNFSSTVLDWQLNSFESISPKKINYLGGYLLDEIISKYPNFHYIKIKNWESNTLLNTLSKASFKKSKSLLLYADTIFRPSIINEVISKTSDIVIAVDSHYKNRYINRPSNDIKKAEIIKPTSGKLINKSCEFSGLISVSKKLSEELKKININKINGNLLDLIKYLRDIGYTIDFVDCSNNWAELNEPGDIAKFILGTKADTLRRLSPMATTFKICKQVSFNLKSWEKKHKLIINNIQSNFPSTFLAIRSSSINEDSWKSSNAGKYLSLLNVDSSSKVSIKSSINNVLKSYKSNVKNNQVLIQEQVKNVELSGVIFTINMESGAPYYVINYDDISGTTDKITQGSLEESKTIIIYEGSNYYLDEVEPKLINITKSIKEITKLLSFDKLNIEFAITKKNEVFIFQVRPVCIDYRKFEIFYPKIPVELKKSANKFIQLRKKRNTIFSNMADWNPAEMIGSHPTPLALDLYTKLITDKNWLKQREEFGYHSSIKDPLIIKFCGQPYIDVGQSFNSFIPKDINNKLKNKLVDSYLKYLKANPKLHDKIEFEVVFTSWTPNFIPEAKVRFNKSNILLKEIKALEESLIKLTRSSIENFSPDNLELRKLIKERSSSKLKSLDNLPKSLKLLRDCGRYGILPFAHAARHSFLSQYLLKSLQSKKSISTHRINEFMQSISTVTSDFCNDQMMVNNGDMQIKELLKKYGHLRPGTYDALVPSYSEKPKNYLNHLISKRHLKNKKEFKLTKNEINLITKVLKPLKLNHSVPELFEYFKKTIIQRELLKFEFTKNISQAIDALILFGKEVGLERREIVNLKISDFRAFSLGQKSFQDLRSIIDKRELEYNVNNIINLPTLIKSQNDFYCFLQSEAQANFITTKSILSKTISIDLMSTKKISSAIVLVRKADPGFDWIFSHNINGLITEYGGANSHMAIRAAELGLPAAIGVGSKIFDELLKSKLIKLNCRNRNINIIS